MSPLMAIGLFLGVPLTLGIVIYALVSAPQWLRSSADTGEEGGPLLLTSPRPLPDPSRLPSELAPAGSLAGGGVSARW